MGKQGIEIYRGQRLGNSVTLGHLKTLRLLWGEKQLWK